MQTWKKHETNYIIAETPNRQNRKCYNAVCRKFTLGAYLKLGRLCNLQDPASTSSRKETNFVQPLETLVSLSLLSVLPLSLLMLWHRRYHWHRPHPYVIVRIIFNVINIIAAVIGISMVTLVSIWIVITIVTTTESCNYLYHCHCHVLQVAIIACIRGFIGVSHYILINIVISANILLSFKHLWHHCHHCGD